MTPVSIATAIYIDKSGPNLQLALQLLVLFYIIKQQLHTPSHWIACLLLPSVYIFHRPSASWNIHTLGIVINHTIFNEGVCNNCLLLYMYLKSSLSLNKWRFFILHYITKEGNFGQRTTNLLSWWFLCTNVHVVWILLFIINHYPTHVHMCTCARGKVISWSVCHMLLLLLSIEKWQISRCTCMYM